MTRPGCRCGALEGRPGMRGEPGTEGMVHFVITDFVYIYIYIYIGDNDIYIYIGIIYKHKYIYIYI